MTLFVREVVEGQKIVGFALAQNAKGPPTVVEHFAPHKEIQDIKRIGTGYYRADHVEVGDRIYRKGKVVPSPDQVWAAYESGFYDQGPE